MLTHDTLRAARPLVAFAAASALLVPALRAQDVVPQRLPPLHKERQVDPPAPDAPTVDLADRPGVPGAGPDAGVGVQANVNALGQNIPNDAANEPSIVVDPKNPIRMAIGWRQFDSISSNFREAGFAYSFDGGRSWKAGTIENGIFHSDPVLEADSNGNYYYLALESSNNWTCFVFRSLDKGKTWPTKFNARGGDKSWFVIDKTGGQGNNHIYESWQTCCGPYANTPFTRSTSGGVSFMTPIDMPPVRPIIGTQAVAANGDLYIAGISDFTGNFAFVKSTNAKNPVVTPTFTGKEINLGGSFPGIGGPPNEAGLLGQVWVDIDRSSGPFAGYVYILCSVDPPGVDPLDVYIARSKDGGNTWDPPVRVNNDAQTAGGWQWFGTLAVAPNGRVDVVWNDTRESQSPTVSRVFYAFSTDGGQTFQGNTPLTPSWNSTVGWPQQNKIGDYYDMQSDLVGVDLAYSATFNNEQDVYYMRINDYDCNGNGVGDAIDLSSGFSKDLNKNTIPDECECLGDINANGSVGQEDLGELLAAYGTSTGQPGFNPAADIDKDGVIGQSDLGILLAGYGVACP